MESSQRKTGGEAEERLVAMRSTGYLRLHALPYYPTAYIWFIAYLWQADNFVIMAAGSEAAPLISLLTMKDFTTFLSV